MMMTWALTDHLCRSCGGRILRCVSGGGPTGGGNPIWKCADCGKAAAAMGPEVLCWCGFHHKHNHSTTAYMCKPFSLLETMPELLSAFQACGCDPKRGGEVGILLERDFLAVATAASGRQRKPDGTALVVHPDDTATLQSLPDGQWVIIQRRLPSA